MIQKVLLYPNVLRDMDFRYTIETISFLEDHGMEAEWLIPLEVPSEEEMLSSLPVWNRSAENQPDLAIVLGGDGTMVQCVHLLHGLDIPIIGVNLGHLGYLTEIEPGSLTEALMQLTEGRYQVERRMMLEATLEEPGRDKQTFYAVNEFVIHRDLMDSLLPIKSFINGESLASFLADGVIVASPCGSTAYNFSAGGPLLSPVADNLLLTPLCSHAMLDRSLVLRGEDELSFSLEAFTRGEKALFIADGRETYEFSAGSRIQVKKSEYTFCLAKIGGHSFYEIMQKKMRP